MRVHGVLDPIPNTETLTPEDTDAALEHILHDQALLAEFSEVGEADFSYEVPGVSRFRVNAFRQRGYVSIVCRAIPFQVRTVDDLGLPQVIKDLADEKRGIILLTGTTGSGNHACGDDRPDQLDQARAHRHARGPDRDFKLMLQAGGQRASGIEQVMGNGDAPTAPPDPPAAAPARPVGELLGQ